MADNSIEETDLFKNNIYDINKLKDIKETDTINVLEKNGDCISFELGGDFFKCDLDNDNIIQYPDFVSLRDGKQNYNLAEISDNTPEDHEKLLYLTTIKESIKESIKYNEIINNLKDYALKYRENYFKEDLKDTLSINTNFNLNVKDIENTIAKIKKISRTLKQTNIPELVNIGELTELAISTIAIFSLFYKDITIKNSKNYIINNIITNYSNKNFESIFNNDEIREKLSELDNILEKFSPSLSVDKGIKDNVEKIVFKILNNEDAMSLANKLSNTQEFQNYLKKNSGNFENIKNNIKSELNPKLIDKLTSSKKEYLQQIIHDISVSSKTSKFTEIFSELNLSPSEDAKNFCVANEIINDILKENTNKEEIMTLNKMLVSQNLENADNKKVVDIIKCITKNILNLDINNILSVKKL